MSWRFLLELPNALPWVTRELCGDPFGLVQVVAGIVALTGCVIALAWSELRRASDFRSAAPFSTVVLLTCLSCGAWFICVEVQRSNLLRHLLERGDLEPVIRAREQALAASLLLDATVFGAVGLALGSASGVWIALRARDRSLAFRVVACGLSSCVLVSGALVLRTAELITPFGSSMGAPSLDPWDKVVGLMRQVDYAQHTIESSRAFTLPLLLLLGLVSFRRVRGSSTPSPRSWILMTSAFAIALTLFAVTRMHRNDVGRRLVFAERYDLPCPDGVDDLPALSQGIHEYDGLLLTINGDHLLVNGGIVHDREQLSDILRSRRELWLALHPANDYPDVVVVAAARGIVPDEVMRWFSESEDAPTLAPLVQRGVSHAESSVLGTLSQKRHCAASVPLSEEALSETTWEAAVNHEGQ